MRIRKSTAETLFIYAAGEDKTLPLAGPTGPSRGIILRNFVIPGSATDLNNIELDDSIDKRAKKQVSNAIMGRIPLTRAISKQYL